MPTSSGVAILVHQLLRNDLTESDIESKVVSDFKSQSLEERYEFATEFCSPDSLSSPLITATAFDPRYKSLKFLSDSHRNIVRKNIKTLIESINNENSVLISHADI
ncbi:hypothetical protein KUTeg_003925 [Tegillarca granosa]|uniref:Uncharacterized protein n=1 Tax=Tegillarca granosa TaxID=220873 RepID=A0ABQ9FNH7_TEGGR|nr:hypothetical protein KUTeg_003925 [Tegillarca granosa]